MEIALSAPDIGEDEIAAVVKVLRSNRLSLGPKMEEFERATAAYVGVPHAAAVRSGTAEQHACGRGVTAQPRLCAAPALRGN